MSESVRYINPILALVGLVSWLMLVRIPAYRGYSIAVLSWLINVTAFWIWTLFIRDPLTHIELANSWARFVQLQALILVAGGALIILWHRRRKYRR
jgi:hypothetical protein